MTLADRLAEAAGPRPGDKRMFWGREFKWSGGSWEPTDGKSAREGVPPEARLYRADPTKPVKGPTWKKRDDGSYEGVGFKHGKVELKRGKGKSWVMVVGDKEHDLGRRASFDTAERKLAAMS